MGPSSSRQTDEAKLIWRIVLLGLMDPSSDAYHSITGSFNSQHAGHSIHCARRTIADAVCQSQSGSCSPAGRPGNPTECSRSTDGRKAPQPYRKRRSADATNSTVSSDASRTSRNKRESGISSWTLYSEGSSNDFPATTSDADYAGCRQADCGSAGSTQHHPFYVRSYTADA